MRFASPVFPPSASETFSIAAAGIVTSVAHVAAPGGTSEERLAHLVADCDLLDGLH